MQVQEYLLTFVVVCGLCRAWLWATVHKHILSMCICAIIRPIHFTEQVVVVRLRLHILLLLLCIMLMLTLEVLLLRGSIYSYVYYCTCTKTLARVTGQKFKCTVLATVGRFLRLLPLLVIMCLVAKFELMQFAYTTTKLTSLYRSRLNLFCWLEM